MPTVEVVIHDTRWQRVDRALFHLAGRVPFRTLDWGSGELQPPKEGYRVIVSSREWIAFLSWARPRSTRVSQLLYKLGQTPLPAPVRPVNWQREIVLAVTLGQASAKTEQIRIVGIAREGREVQVTVQRLLGSRATPSLEETGFPYHLVVVSRADLFEGIAYFTFVDESSGNPLARARVLLLQPSVGFGK